MGAALGQAVDPPRRSNGRELTAYLDEAAIARRVVAVYVRVVSADLDGA